MDALDRLGEALAAAKDACTKASQQAIADELRANQETVDALIATITRTRDPVISLADKPPAQFFGDEPKDAPLELVGMAETQVRQDWRNHCETMRNDPQRFLQEDYIAPTVGDYVRYFQAQLAAGLTELSIQSAIIVEGK